MPISEERVWDTLREREGEPPEGMRPYIENILESYNEHGEEGIRDIRHELRNRLLTLRKLSKSPMGMEFVIQYQIIRSVRKICEELLREDFYHSRGRLWLEN